MHNPLRRSSEQGAVLPSERANRGEELEAAGSATLIDVGEERRVTATRVSSPLREATRRYMRNWAAVISLIIVILLILAAIFAPLLHTSDPNALDYNALNQGPTVAHWFGTDPEGRDEYTRILYGLRIPFMISFSGTIITMIIALTLGLAAGLYGGFIDSLLSRFTDFMFAFPSFLLAIIIVSLFGSAFDSLFPNGVGRAVILTCVFALVSWPPLMRFVRSLALGMKETQFIEAARASGTTNLKIMWRHMFPNVWGLVLIQGALTVAYIIGTEAVLSIIGLGVNQPTPDLGSMLYDGAQNMDANYWEALFPSLFLTILILAFTFIGDGVRDAVDPRMNQ